MSQPLEQIYQQKNILNLQSFLHIVSETDIGASTNFFTIHGQHAFFFCSVNEQNEWFAFSDAFLSNKNVFERFEKYVVVVKSNHDCRNFESITMTEEVRTCELHDFVHALHKMCRSTNVKVLAGSISAVLIAEQSLKLGGRL